MNEDTRQVLSELKAKMDDIRDKLQVMALIPEYKREGTRLMALQREGLRLARIFKWLVDGIREDL